MPKNGVVLYTIEPNGCLNGVYTNEDSHGILFNEIARKKVSPSCLHDIDGDYDCAYFDNHNTPYTAALNIKKISTNLFEFNWKTQTSPPITFSGTGYIMNEKQIVVRYE